MGAGVAKQFQPVGFRARQRLFMAKNHSRGIVFDASQCDKAIAYLSFDAAGHGVLLTINIDPGNRVA